MVLVQLFYLDMLLGQLLSLWQSGSWITQTRQKDLAKV
jgi:hypothetical protein